ncbi:signal transduction histidine kinase [Actinoplanes lutulentus]|uniref:histidine kinase n=1 Tax=Actinoplanes lutulentus TaxID=1287878 RepID=A0A327ZN44_9ACTN|nr:histidine kinase [Actinoplanes lutulentus]MBB2944183.1 signal transduction histidine kinase [Actinoplanes lutulentus]RAK42584.1 histidine kinase [Actinoplanes lutulentus]
MRDAKEPNAKDPIATEPNAKDRAVDVAAILISCFCAMLLAGEAESTGRIHGEETFWVLLLGCAGSLALWWRRHHPFAVALFLMPIAAITDTAAYAGVAALYTLVIQRRTRALAVTIVLSVFTAALYGWRRPDPTLPPVAEVLLTSALLVVAVAVAVAVRSRFELIESLRHRAEQAEEQARLRADRLRSLERERIAREMHDSLAHRISMVSLHAGALQIRPDLTADEVAKAAATIRDSAHHALEDLREILGVLRAGETVGEPDGGLRPQPDLSRLSDLLTEAETAGVRVEAVDHLNGTPVSASLGRTVYRLVQEGLTNAGKHAPAAPVRLLLERSGDDELHVLIANPLTPGQKTAVPGAHAGLVGLTERVELIGGRLRHGVRADPFTGAAFYLEAWLPWPS